MMKRKEQNKRAAKIAVVDDKAPRMLSSDELQGVVGGDTGTEIKRPV